MQDEYKKLVYRAGTIPYHIDEAGTIRMLFMKPSDSTFGGDAYQIGKGRVEDGEDHKDAALREAKEELGLFIGNTILTEEIGVFMGRTTMYIAKVKNRDMFGEPDFETESTRWMTLEDFMLDGRELHRPVVQACHRKMVELG
jgi:8-oxo-dGTP pyrophosphatase MutT (NUDIX family)